MSGKSPEFTEDRWVDRSIHRVNVLTASRKDHLMADREAVTRRVSLAERAPALRAAGLSKSYGAVRAAQDVSFSLWHGEVLALAGENGAGKSTVIGMLGGTRRPDAGSLEVDGAPTTFASAADAHRAGIGVVFQEPMLVPQLSVAANVFLTLEPRSFLRVIDRKTLNVRFSDLASRTAIDLNPELPVSELSVAQRQLVQVLRVNALGAKVIILDEPTAALAPDDRTRLFTLIRNLTNAAEPISFIVVSHFLEELEEHCDRAVVLRNGAVVGELANGDVTASRLARLMRGGEGATAASGTTRRAAARRSDAAPTLEVRGLRVSGSTPIDLQVRPGEILGLAGLVGSGRTGILSAIALGHRRTAGDVSVDNQRLRNAVDAVRAGLLFLPEDRRASLIWDWPLWKNVTLPSLATTSSYRVTRPKLERARTEELMQRLSVKATSSAATVASLSGGNQQKVALAKLLAADFRVALLDEPTHGVDVHAKAEIELIIQELAAEGRSFVIVSAEFDELLRFATSVMTIHKGGMVSHYSSPEKLTAEGLLVETSSGRPYQRSREVVG
jgi:rhamnose transport system ATP-binding protein